VEKITTAIARQEHDRRPNFAYDVTYEAGFGGEITQTYAINEDISRKLRWKRDWLGRKPTGRDLVDWLEKKGCRLDSSEGPAYIQRYRNGATEEIYFRDGKLHREDGPADVWRFADGTTEERYYRDGKFLKAERSAPRTPSSTGDGAPVRPAAASQMPAEAVPV
jgi:hypothetical protein